MKGTTTRAIWTPVLGLILLASVVSTGLARPQLHVQVFDNPQTVRGLLADRAYYTPGDTLYRVDLAEADSLLDWIVPAKTMVFFNPDSTIRYCFLSKNTEMDGLVCRGSGHNWMTCFYPNGRLKLVWLAEDATIEGIQVRKATWWRAVWQQAQTAFHPNGELKTAWLAEDQTIQGELRKKGSMVMFDDRGVLLKP